MIRNAFACGGMLRVIAEEKTALIHVCGRISDRDMTRPDESRLTVFRLIFKRSIWMLSDCCPGEAA
nr:MAG TPA: hypothetical protein [Caudoviricetes sp.]